MPNELGNKIIFSKYLITNHTQKRLFSIINANEDNAILCQQLLQQLQPGIHHAQPLVMASQVLSLFADYCAQPFLDLRIIDVIVVDPPLVTCVIWRIDINTLHPPLVSGQQRFQGLQIVAPDDHILTAVVLVVLAALIIAVPTFQYPKRYFLMMVDHLIFSDPFKCWHGCSPPGYRTDHSPCKLLSTLSLQHMASETPCCAVTFVSMTPPRFWAMVVISAMKSFQSPRLTIQKYYTQNYDKSQRRSNSETSPKRKCV